MKNFIAANLRHVVAYTILVILLIVGTIYHTQTLNAERKQLAWTQNLAALNMKALQLTHLNFSVCIDLADNTMDAVGNLKVDNAQFSAVKSQFLQLASRLHDLHLMYDSDTETVNKAQESQEYK